MAAELFHLAPAAVSGATVSTVNARDLHAFLEVGRDFTNWIKDRIAAYGFAEGTDYVTDLLANFGEKGQGRPSREFHLTLDMAKELAMVERNEKGREARLYFIECERRARAAPDPIVALNDPTVMRGLLLSYSEKVLELQAQNAELAPKAEALDRLSTAEGSLCITDAAKTLQVQPRALFMFLRSHRWIYTRTGGADEVAYQDKLASGLLEHKTTTVHRSDGSEKVRTQVRVTPKGLARLAREFPSAVAAA